MFVNIIMDTMSGEQRSYCMSRIHSKDTKPEILVRKFLWHNGFRYRKNVRKLPGSPDIVIRKLKTAIFIHGCFWHGHNVIDLSDNNLADSICCKVPHSNRRFWLDKINRNRDRDSENRSKLMEAGWRVITVWECELTKKRRDGTLSHLLAQLAPKSKINIYQMSEEYQEAAEPEIEYNHKEAPNLR